MHLFGKGERSDAVAYASAEVGFVFCTIAILTGAIWAKPVWGVWWTWDPKLTLTLVLWFIYASYLMLRAFGPKGIAGRALWGRPRPHRGHRRSHHLLRRRAVALDSSQPRDLAPAAESDALDPRMLVAVLVSMIAFTALFIYLIMERYSLKKAETDVDEIFQYAA